MNKFIGILVLGLCAVMVTDAHAAASTRGAKTTASINYSTTVSSVAVNGAGVVYAAILSTGTAGTDYTALFDSGTVVGITTAGNTALKARINVSSATQNTIVTFDPPLQFNNGIVAGNSSAANWSLIIFEKGRVSDR